MKEVTSSQLGKMLFLSIISMKLTIIPALVTKYCGTDGKIGIIILTMLDFLTMLIYVNCMEKYPNMTMGEILKVGLGKVAHILFFTILFLFFGIKCVFIVKQAHIYLVDNLVEEMHWLAFTIPLLLFLFYVMIKGRRVLARTIEFLFFMVLISFAFTLLIPIMKWKVTNILPLMENDWGSLLKGLFFVNFIIGDYFLLLVFVGRVKIDASLKRTLIGYALSAVVLVWVFYFVFYGVFGKIAINQGLAISDLPLSAVYPSTIGRLDWVSVICWVFVILMIMAIMFVLVKSCFEEVIPCNKYWSSLIIVGVLFVVMAILYFDLEAFIQLITSTWFCAICLAVQLLIPFVVWLASVRVNRKMMEKPVRFQKEQSQ